MGDKKSVGPKKNDIKFIMDGECLKQVVKVPDHKFTAKEGLDMINSIEGQVAQLEGAKLQAEKQLESVKLNILNASEHKKMLAPFKEELTEFQLKKLRFLLGVIKAECEKAACEMAQKEIDKDPSAYTDEQMRRQKYAMYQQLLGRHEKVANKISATIIKKHLYDVPIFDDPFKE